MYMYIVHMYVHVQCIYSRLAEEILRKVCNPATPVT